LARSAVVVAEAADKLASARLYPYHRHPQLAAAEAAKSAVACRLSIAVAP
jgi:hypothetical protein